MRFPDERELIVTDTVGFIRDLPQDLVTAFRATLEELAQADLLMHVLDASDPAMAEQQRSVEKILFELELSDKPRLLVLNKIDRLDAEGFAVAAVRSRSGGPVGDRARDGAATADGD
jgi:GTP-binding protein HflX